MGYLVVDNPETQCVLPVDLAVEYTFSLDPFQKHAIKAIYNEENVLVTAKQDLVKLLLVNTKLLIVLKKASEYFIQHQLKVFPIKSFMI